MGEGAEPAAGVTDVGEVQVPVDHIGDVRTHSRGPDVVGQPGQRLEGGAVTGHERHGRVVVTGVGQGRRILLGERQCLSDIGRQPFRRRDPPGAVGDTVPIAEHRRHIGTGVGPAPGQVDGVRQVGPTPGLVGGELVISRVGLLPGVAPRPDRERRQSRVRVGKGRDVRADPRIGPRRTSDVLRVQGESRPQL